MDESIRNIILHGSGKEKIHFSYLTENGRKQQETHPFEGIIPNLTRRYKETESQTVREELAKYLNAQTCPECQGTRLCQAARHVHVAGQAIYEISAFPLKKATPSFDPIALTGHKQSVAERIIK